MVDSRERTDAALVRAARLGDQQAFEAIVERHGPTLHRFALRMTGYDDDLAADATQDALVSAWRGLDGFDGRSELRTWLYRLLHRRVVDRMRARRPVPVQADDLELSLVTSADVTGTGFAGAAPEDPLRQVLRRELVDALRSALLELPTQQRAAWLLREMDDLSYQEIADTLGSTTAGVRGLLERSRTTLGVRLAAWR